MLPASLFPVLLILPFTFASLNRDRSLIHLKKIHGIAKQRRLAESRLGRHVARGSKSKTCLHISSSAPSVVSDNHEAISDVATDTSNQTSSSKAAHASASSSGILQVSSSCGPIGASRNVTSTSGPNGNINWLNCGLTDGGWQPPYVTVEEIITLDLSAALKNPSSPFHSCSSFISIFEKYANQYSVPSIMLASFAMQESSCNPNTVGEGGEKGLMQLSEDKCAGAPNGNCLDPDFNIQQGAKFFADTLTANGGDLFKTVGAYNGWTVGMTYGSATAAADTPCCRCQNNLDYLHQFFNGWCQNIDAYTHSPPLGKYFNLNQCSSS